MKELKETYPDTSNFLDNYYESLRRRYWNIIQTNSRLTVQLDNKIRELDKFSLELLREAQENNRRVKRE